MLDNELDELLDVKNIEENSFSQHKRKSKSLGRGLDALLGGEDLSFDGAPVALDNVPSDKIDINNLVAGKYQPRTEFDAEALRALSDSIKEKGVLQPLLVRKKGDIYEIIAGERRWRASKMAGLKEVPVIIKDFDDREVLEVALVENLMRENLSAIEEAEGFQRLINEFSHTQEALAQIVGKSRSHVTNTLRLLTLPSSVQNMIKENKLSAGHARALVGLANAEEMAKKIISKDLSVRQVEELVAKQKEPAKEKNNKEKNEDVEEIEKELIKNLGLRLKISPDKKGGGKIVLQYSSIAELDMIVNTLTRQETTRYAKNSVFKEDGKNEKFSINIID